MSKSTATDWRLILIELLGGECIPCGSTNDLTLDHIIPTWLGGRHIASNIQVLCQICHRRKNGQEGIKLGEITRIKNYSRKPYVPPPSQRKTTNDL